MSTDQNFYQLLDLAPTASSDEIRDAYRKKSKIYHPDTTTLPKEVAIEKFRLLNDAYGTLSSPDLRRTYDYQLGISSVQHFSHQRTQDLDTPLASSLIEIQERPLSSGELFALLILGITFLGCLVLALILGFARGEMMLRETSSSAEISVVYALESLKTPLVFGKDVFVWGKQI